jgi:lysozyme family protein
MTAPKFTAALAKEYSDLFNRCEIAADKMTEVEGALQRILDFQNRYAAIATQIFSGTILRLATVGPVHSQATIATWVVANG